MYKLQVNFEKRQIHLRELVGRGSKGSLTEKLLGLDKETRKIVQSALSDLIDTVIPLSLVGLVDISPGVVGLAGTVTSVLGAVSLWPAPKDKAE